LGAVKSYFFYYFSAVPGAIPYFEVVNCADDDDAAARCSSVLADRHNATAEVWLEDRLVCRIRADPRAGGARGAGAGANVAA
jgi:transglutaminase-like putative cysteine protease